MGFDIFLNFGYRMVSIRIILDKTPYNIQMLFKISLIFRWLHEPRKYLSEDCPRQVLSMMLRPTLNNSVG